jgi:hypothetical protein
LPWYFPKNTEDWRPEKAFGKDWVQGLLTRAFNIKHICTKTYCHRCHPPPNRFPIINESESLHRKDQVWTPSQTLRHGCWLKPRLRIP